MRVAVLGGGGFRVPLIHRALDDAGVPIGEIALHDVSRRRLDVIADVLADPRVSTTTDLDTALDGAAFVVSAVRVGGTSGRVDDERTALDLGLIGQETVGAGGLVYAARALPELVRVANRVAARAPEAWLISMTNPAGIVTEASAEILGDRVIGVCDSPTALVRRACAALGIDPGASLASVTDAVDVDYLGINHLGWLRALRIDGADRLPELIADPDALARVEEGRLFGPDVIGALGTLPNEYLYWHYAAREALAGISAARRTRGEQVHDDQQRFYAAAAAAPSRARALWQATNDERNRTYFAELRTGERGERDVEAGGYESIAAALMAALCGRGPATLILDVRNAGTVAALPPEAVLELPCRVDESGAVPRPVAPPTLHELGVMSVVRASERAIAEAALARSHAAALRAFAIHPLVGSLEAARTLADLAVPDR